MLSSLQRLILLLVSFTLAVQAASVQKRQQTCNGSSSLCSRLYSNVTFAGAHNSYSIASGAGSLAANQNVSVTQQLDAGIRMLQSQAHKSTNATVTGAGIDLCHTSCSLLQGGSLENYLSQVKAWTDANPTEVVTLLIVNSDGLPATQFAQAFESTGLNQNMFSSTIASFTRYGWPTLGSMVSSGKRVVGFLTLDADIAQVDYLFDEFSNMWENSYNQNSIPINCTIDRIGESVTDSSSIMYLANNFRNMDLFGSSSGITTPDTANLGTTNSQQTVLQTANNCAAQHGNVYPNFILTDYSTTPDYEVMKAVAQINGVQYTAPTANTNSVGGKASSSPASASTSSGASSLKVTGVSATPLLCAVAFLLLSSLV